MNRQPATYPCPRGADGPTPQRIVVFHQNMSGRNKIAGIEKYGNGRIELTEISIDEPLPPVLDDGSEYLPETIEADLVIDYLKHPDLSQDLAALCLRLGIPVVASGKKHRMPGVMTPKTCCGLARNDCLGHYGERFGSPCFSVLLKDGRIDKVDVLRGAPCGATWEAAKRIEGLPVEEAGIRIGLETQYFCTADPSGWDPIFGKSPVHFAGELHRAALVRALGEGE